MYRRSEADNRPLGIRDGFREFMLLQPYWCEIDIFGRPIIFYIPRFYVVNGASVPKICWSLGYNPTGELFRPSIPHDFLCDFKGHFHYCDYFGGPPTGVGRLTSKETHQLFGYLCKEECVSIKRRIGATWAVKNFGPRWSEHEKIAKLPLEFPEKNSSFCRSQ